MGTQVPRAGGSGEKKCPLKQAQEEAFFWEILRPIFQHENRTFHWWSFGAVAELLDNAVDEIPHGATKVLIDTVPNPRDGSPSLLVQDDGGGMDPDSLRNCMNAVYPKRKPPNSIGQNGKGFKAGVSCLGANVIIFTRCLNTRMPAQSIGLLSHVAGDGTCQEHIRGPMVHYKYDPMTAQIIGYERQPGQFCFNMSMLLRLSPYSSEEELLQNFNDVGPHGTKIIVFNLSRDIHGNLNLDFDTDKKDIRISDVKMKTEHGGVEEQNNNLVYQYRRSFRAYVSILYLGLPNYFRIILRGEEVKRCNLATELEHSRCIIKWCNVTRREDKVVMGFLDGAKDDNMDRFCFYHKQRLILAFVPLCASSHKNWSIVGVLQATRLKPAKNKQDFVWSTEIPMLQNIIKGMTTSFWEYLKGNQFANAIPSSQLTWAPRVSRYEANLTASKATGMQSQVNPSAPTHRAVPSFESCCGGMPSSYSVPRAPPPSLPALPVSAKRKRQQTLMAMVNAWYSGISSNPSPVHPTTLPSWSKNGGRPSHGVRGAPAPCPPTFPMASMAPDRKRPTMPAMASNNGMNFNASPVFTARPSPAYRAPPFFQPNCSSMPRNGLVRAPAPHLGAVSRRQPKPAMAPAAPPRSAAVNTIGGLTPSRAFPPAAMVALRDLPIKMERDGAVTYVDTAYPLPGGVAPAVSGTAAGVGGGAPATSDAAPSSPTVILALSAAKPSAMHGGATSSRQEREPEGGNNQGEQGANLLPDQGKPVVTVKMERE